MGYSCILFAEACCKAGGKQYISIERDPVFGAVMSSLVDLAGLNHFIKVLIGPSEASIRRLAYGGWFPHRIDMLFLDHYKPAYKADLKLCEELRLISPGSVLVADNVIKPGNPPYLEYVRSTVEQKRQALEIGEDECCPSSRFAETTAKQYAKRHNGEKLVVTRGNPNLVYESRLVHSFEPTGVPVSPIRCHS